MIQQFGSNVMKGLMVVGAALVFSGGSAEAVVTNYVEFGKTAMDSAPPLIKAADTLTKARYIAQMVGEQMKADGIPPNTHFGGRIRALGSEGNCGDCASRIQDAMKGAGLTMDGQSRIFGERSLAGIVGNVDIVNRTHGAFALKIGAQVYIFDLWQYGRQHGDFGGFSDTSKWNGMKMEDWKKDVNGQDYNTFGNDETDNTFDDPQKAFDEVVMPSTAPASTGTSLGTGTGAGTGSSAGTGTSSGTGVGTGTGAGPGAGILLPPPASSGPGTGAGTATGTGTGSGGGMQKY